MPLFGLLQAMASVAQDVTGDDLCSIKMGAHRVVYVLRGALYFVAVSSAGEPEAVLQKQLEFLHNQVLFVLTSKVHDVLRINAAKDIRELLGYDSMKLIHESCKDAVTPACIAFTAVTGLVCAPDLREDVVAHLRRCVGRSGAALGLLLHGDALVGYVTSPSMALELATEDVVLLTRFVGHAKSLHSHDQNWIPLCLPAFNARAYLQAYTSSLAFPISSGPSSPRSPSTNNNVGVAPKQLNLSLVLIATSSDPLVFGELHDGRRALEGDLLRTDIPQRLFIAAESQQAYLSTYAVPLGCAHFLHVHRPQLPPAAAVPSKGKAVSKKKATTAAAPPSLPSPSLPLPAQCHTLCLEGTMSSQAETDRCGGSDPCILFVYLNPYFEHAHAIGRVFLEYTHLALRLRCGSSRAEHTLATQHHTTSSSNTLDTPLRPSHPATLVSTLESGIFCICSFKNIPFCAPVPCPHPLCFR